MANHNFKLFHGYWPHGDQVIHGCVSKAGPRRLRRLVWIATSVFFFFLFLTIRSMGDWMDIPIIKGSSFRQMISPSRRSDEKQQEIPNIKGSSFRQMISPSRRTDKKQQEIVEFPLNCSDPGLPQKCPDNYPSVFEPDEISSSETCPDYFRWIHQDLQQWKISGVTRDMIRRGRRRADFRLVIVKGKAYVERYSKPYQTRDVITIWGILQLLRLYPGKIPDLDLLFYSGDVTVIKKSDYRRPNARPPPVFHYCSEEESLDIVFPDWTFWGWAEVNIKPWEEILRAIKKGNERIKWENREPYAHWKGNPYVSVDRVGLLKCNLTDKYDWNVRLYRQDWKKEVKEGFKHSKLEDQCTHRYKIYIEGATWSVSEKYILACDSMTLMIKPKYFDFFSRSLVPMQHYWPIDSKNECRDLKFAVEWGNNHTNKAQAIGKAGSKWIEELLTMRNVYDYMFHLLNEYSKLLKFKPKIPPKAKMVCSEMIACLEEGLFKEFKMQSMVLSPSDKLPCALPPPYEPQAIQASVDAKEEITRQVERWGNEYWKKLDDTKQ